MAETLDPKISLASTSALRRVRATSSAAGGGPWRIHDRQGRIPTPGQQHRERDESDEYHVIAPNSTEEIIDRLHRHELIYRNTPKRQWPVFMAVLEFNLRYSEAATVCRVPERTFRDWRQKLTDIFSVHDERKRPLSDEELGELNKIRRELEAKIDAIR